MTARPNVRAELETLMQKRIIVFDGAMGTTIRGYGLNETDARGERFAKNEKDLLNNGDILSVTRPDVIGDIHRRFLEAGADIIETNTFSGTSIAQSEFFIEDPREKGGRKDPAFFQKIIDDKFLNDLAWEINFNSAQQCRKWADIVGEKTGRKRYVAGAVGPLTVSLSQFPDLQDLELPVRDLRPGEVGLCASDSRADRGRGGHLAGGDHLRLAERQGGAGGDRGGL